jgi:ubiquinone/menaquinone biosynthesis C-methylase UbiE
MATKYFQEVFSDQTEVDYWDDIYYRDDSYGMCVRQRLEQALSWLEECSSSGNSIILDAGCGAGHAVYEIAEKGFNVIGMDYSYSMIRRTLHKFNTAGKPAVLLQGEIEALPFKNSSFDSILCLGVLTYLGSEEKALSELSRILKPGGELIICVINKARLVNRFDLPRLVKYRLQKAYSNRRSYLIPKFKKSLNRQGLSIIEYRTIPHGIFTFCGREIWPKKLNMKITLLLERVSNVPLVDSFAGLYLFRTRKTAIGHT